MSIETDLTTQVRALGAPLPLRLVVALARAASSCCVCELADALKAPHYATSRAASHLSAVGLLRRENVGRWVYYALDEGPVSEAIECLARTEAFADDRQRLSKRPAMRAGNAGGV